MSNSRDDVQKKITLILGTRKYRASPSTYQTFNGNFNKKDIVSWFYTLFFVGIDLLCRYKRILSYAANQPNCNGERKGN
ncbi:hypothetical protein EV198_1573 [Roseivirga ehrenbergii]|nr:hypothetical protein EV198_1573 [Roseivirga ehrenbergii]